MLSCMSVHQTPLWSQTCGCWWILTSPARFVMERTQQTWRLSVNLLRRPNVHTQLSSTRLLHSGRSWCTRFLLPLSTWYSIYSYPPLERPWHRLEVKWVKYQIQNYYRNLCAEQIIFFTVRSGEKTSRANQWRADAKGGPPRSRWGPYDWTCPSPNFI